MTLIKNGLDLGGQVTEAGELNMNEWIALIGCKIRLRTYSYL